MMTLSINITLISLWQFPFGTCLFDLFSAYNMTLKLVYLIDYLLWNPFLDHQRSVNWNLSAPKIKNVVGATDQCWRPTFSALTIFWFIFNLLLFRSRIFLYVKVTRLMIFNFYKNCWQWWLVSMMFLGNFFLR